MMTLGLDQGPWGWAIMTGGKARQRRHRPSDALAPPARPPARYEPRCRYRRVITLLLGLSIVLVGCTSGNASSSAAPTPGKTESGALAAAMTKSSTAPATSTSSTAPATSTSSTAPATSTSSTAPATSTSSAAGTSTWLTALIAALGVVIGAVATAFGSAYAARRKIQEIKLTNTFQQAKDYLESARQYKEDIYLPLAIAAHNLHTAFLSFKAVAEDAKMPAAELAFSRQISTFLTFTDSQFRAGASAAFTFKLDDTLTGFISFLDKSRSATAPVTLNEVGIVFSLAGFNWNTQRNLARRLPISLNYFGGLALGILGAGIGVRQNPVLVCAPLSSKDFAKRFTLDINVIKSCIKEVTLGSYSAPSAK